MADTKLVGQNYTTPDLVAKVTGRAKYAEDFRAEGMLFAKLLLSPMPHARVLRIDTSAAEKLPGVRAVLALKDPSKPETARVRYQGEEVAAVAAILRLVPSPLRDAAGELPTAVPWALAITCLGQAVWTAMAPLPPPPAIPASPSAD